MSSPPPGRAKAFRGAVAAAPAAARLRRAAPPPFSQRADRRTTRRGAFAHRAQAARPPNRPAAPEIRRNETTKRVCGAQAARQRNPACAGLAPRRRRDPALRGVTTVLVGPCAGEISKQRPWRRASRPADDELGARQQPPRRKQRPSSLTRGSGFRRESARPRARPRLDAENRPADPSGCTRFKPSLPRRRSHWRAVRRTRAPRNSRRRIQPPRDGARRRRNHRLQQPAWRRCRRRWRTTKQSPPRKGSARAPHARATRSMKRPGLGSMER